MMKERSKVITGNSACQRAREIFDQHRQAAFTNTDRMFSVLMIVQWLAGIAAALWISPRTWAGPYSQTHIHVWAAVFLGGAISLFPIALALGRPGCTSTRFIIAIAQMLYSGLLIHLSGGRIETHFHVFGSLAFLAFYRDWRVLVPATLVVAADHFLRGLFWPQSVFGVLAVSQWRWLEHTTWVLFEDTFLFIAIRKSLREMWDLAERTAEIETLNESLEQRVAQRTELLQSSNQALKAEIVEREHAEAELASQRSFLRQIIDLNPSFIFAKDRRGRFTMVNRSLAEAYGTTVDNLIGKTDADFNNSSKEIEWFRRDDLEVMITGSEKFIPEEMITDSRGKVRWLQTIKRPMFSEDGTVGQMLGVATDITRHKELEEQLRQSQKMEAVGQLAGGIAHDFNNLLTAINGYSQLSLRRVGPDDLLRRNIEAIKSAGDRAASLTRQLLAFSRRQMLQAKVLDLNAVVGEMDKLLRRLIGEDVDLITLLKPGLGQIKADPGQIEQVLMNLVVNARDAMPKGGKITIETEHAYLDEAYAGNHFAVKPGRYVALTVSDSGTGMDTETQKRIFDPFFTTKEVGKGTGLGLSTVYGIVKQSGGHICVYSEVDKGTTFKVYLPRFDEAPDEAEEEDALGRGSKGKETVLLVEDEEVVRSLAKEVLEEDGYAVIIASNGQEGLQMSQDFDGRIDLLITDVVMPQMGGRELAEGISVLRPDTKVLFMSGYTDDAIVRHGILDDNTFFLQKPFTPNALTLKTREALDQSLAGKPTKQAFH
jgi:PAS domain S-box-containing protein